MPHMARCQATVLIGRAYEYRIPPGWIEMLEPEAAWGDGWTMIAAVDAGKWKSRSRSRRGLAGSSLRLQGQHVLLSRCFY